MRIDFLSIFPGMFAPTLDESILGIAQGKGLVEFHTHDVRDWSGNKHRKIDDKPFGGGPGMVMRAEVIVSAVEEVRGMAQNPGRLIFMTPKGETFNQQKGHQLAGEERLIIVCGRYEGFDERIMEVLQPEEISIGDYILTGGELAGMVVADAVTRLIPGVLGSEESLQHESFENGLLDFPQYTQPAEWRGISVPEVLLSGNHAKIAEWRKNKAIEKTRARRPDILES